LFLKSGFTPYIEVHAGIGQYEYDDENILILLEPLENVVFLEGGGSFNDFDFIIKIFPKKDIQYITIKAYSINFFGINLSYNNCMLNEKIELFHRYGDVQDVLMGLYEIHISAQDLRDRFNNVTINEIYKKLKKCKSIETAYEITYSIDGEEKNINLKLSYNIKSKKDSIFFEDIYYIFLMIVTGETL
jgi:hypothetical protein